MKLSEALEEQVVRNARNGSHYRFVRLEKGKARIRPLELFPNGLLIAKPTPTLVDANMEVLLIGSWEEGMIVQGKPSASRRVYENELVRLEQRLIELEAAYMELPVSGKGKLSRGSWANKVKCCRSRIEVLKRGLGFVDATLTVHAQTETAPVELERGDLVQVPSGRLAEVLGFVPMGDSTYVQVRTFLKGVSIQGALPYEVLRPGDQARLCTV